MSYSIAIEGPAGAGKSTIAKQIAQKLNFIYVDTGAMYRAVALYMIRKGINIEENDKISKECRNVEVTITYANEEQQVILNGENVNRLIRTEEVGKMASCVAKNKDVRLKLVELQRKMAVITNVIMDGRDIGTYVLPEANVKIYLTAAASERAKRRYLELSQKGVNCKINEIEADIIARDKQDMNREFAPLRQAEDAVLVDSSNMTIEQVVDCIIELYKNEKH